MLTVFDCLSPLFKLSTVQTFPDQLLYGNHTLANRNDLEQATDIKVHSVLIRTCGL